MLAMSECERIRAAIIRGGTSKGVYLLASELPSDPAIRDKVILAIFGSPDPRQINGLGGADPLTSKVAIIAPSTRRDADVDYTFGYVGIDKAVVDYQGNCGTDPRLSTRTARSRSRQPRKEETLRILPSTTV